MADPTMKATVTEDVTGTLEGVELQMLRGIFAAHDENKDGIINKSQLAEALVSLGFSPSEKLMTKFYLENAARGKKNWKIDLECFLSAAGKWLDSAEDCASDVIYLFEQFDKTKSRDVRWVLVWLGRLLYFCAVVCCATRFKRLIGVVVVVFFLVAVVKCCATCCTKQWPPPG